ncbi:hypothetical protein ACHAWC_009734 [Mediolabrus comicus]
MHSTKPPLSDSCFPITTFLSNFVPKYGPSEQCADPVTGSSSMPILGPKNRDRKSMAGLPGRLTLLRLVPPFSIVSGGVSLPAQQHMMTPLEKPSHSDRAEYCSDKQNMLRK